MFSSCMEATREYNSKIMKRKEEGISENKEIGDREKHRARKIKAKDV